MPEINPLPVSEETREELREVKGEEESYDDVLQRLVETHHRYDLSERYHEVAGHDAENLIGLDVVVEDDDGDDDGADDDGADDGADDGEGADEDGAGSGEGASEGADGTDVEGPEADEEPTDDGGDDE